jgi:hypothetical protein
MQTPAITVRGSKFPPMTVKDTSGYVKKISLLKERTIILACVGYGAHVEVTSDQVSSPQYVTCN